MPSSPSSPPFLDFRPLTFLELAPFSIALGAMHARADPRWAPEKTAVASAATLWGGFERALQRPGDYFGLQKKAT
eukprot:5737211-Prymnesium_polylepis.1